MPKTTKNHTRSEAVEMIAQMLIVHVCTWMVVLGLAAYCASLYYVEYEDHAADRETAVMDSRPNAPGSDEAVWEEHQKNCWRFEPKGQATGAIVRIHPNDPFVYTTKPRLVERALDQAVNKHDRGLDRVLAFCTNHITQKGR